MVATRMSGAPSGEATVDASSAAARGGGARDEDADADASSVGGSTVLVEAAATAIVLRSTTSIAEVGDELSTRGSTGSERHAGKGQGARIMPRRTRQTWRTTGVVLQRRLLSAFRSSGTVSAVNTSEIRIFRLEGLH